MIEMYTPLSGGDQSTPTETPDYHAATSPSKKREVTHYKYQRRSRACQVNWTRVENNSAKKQKVNSKRSKNPFYLQKPLALFVKLFCMSSTCHVCCLQNKFKSQRCCENLAKMPGKTVYMFVYYGILHNCLTMTLVNKYRSLGPTLYHTVFENHPKYLN